VPEPHRVTTLPGSAGWWGCQPTLDAKKTYLAHAKMKINEVHGQLWSLGPPMFMAAANDIFFLKKVGCSLIRSKGYD
jgi:hypothetical protein